MLIANRIEELGYHIAAATGELNEAISIAKSTDFDLAILDVNINGKAVLPVVEAVKVRKLPTGYGSSITGGIPTLSVAAKAIPT